MSVVSCKRCGVPCRVADRRDPKALMLRAAAGPSGFCVNCAVTDWLMNTYPINTLLDERGPDSLLRPGMRDQIAPVMEVLGSDANPDEIDWPLVVANWDLPLPPIKPTATNPYVPHHPRRAPKWDGVSLEPDPGTATETAPAPAAARPVSKAGRRRLAKQREAETPGPLIALIEGKQAEDGTDGSTA